MVNYLNGIYILLIMLSWNKLSYSYDWNNNFTVLNVVCTSDTCYDYANFINKNMNRNVDPCTDFYEFVCGRNRNPLRYYYPAWSTPIDMTMKAAKDIKKILEEVPSVADSLDLKKAKNIYRACVELPSLGIMSSNAIYNYIQGSDYFPLFSESSSGSQKKRKSWVEVHNYYLSLTADAGLYDTFSTGHKANNFEPILHIADVFTPFGKIVFKNPLKNSITEKYENYLKAILFSVFSYGLLKIYPKILTSRIQAIIKFRSEIHAIQTLYPRFFGEPLHYDTMTVGELENWYKTLTTMERVAKISWIEAIYLMYNKSKTLDEIKQMPVSVLTKSYHQSLVQLIQKTPNSVIVNHMHFYFIEKHLEFNTRLDGMLLETIIVNKKFRGTVMYPGKAWHYCILANPLKDAIGKAYVKRYFPMDKKRKIEDYVAEIKEVFLLQIHDSKWLDANLMDKFTHVLNDIKLAIGYPNYYDNAHLQAGNDPIVNPVNVEAFYCARANVLTISASTFQLPLYDPNLPKTILYGSIGMLISHELHHAFGPQAVAQCYSFTLPRSKLQLYNDRTDCFFKKYNKLPVKELRFLKPPPLIDGKKTLDENIADAMGLRLAYEAFRKDAWENSECSMLSIYRGITCEQMFFIAFGAVFCSDIQADVMLEEVLQEDHSTPRVRVNEAVANMKEFSRAFDCPKKALMNPVNRCDLWR